ncbi:TPA: AAA family ATPase [Candidatus Woesearchaeota archaeon]|nr:AAA family ATPase [Candidatus Woesearchaeota archaeon]
MVIITIGGMPGSGKSTVGRMIAVRLGIPFFSMGDVRREFANEHGMTLAELNARGENDPASDKMVDEYQSKLPETTPSFVIDSRLGYHFLPQSFKVYLKVDSRAAAERIYAMKRHEEHWRSIEDGVRSVEERAASDLRRYKKYYGLNPYDEKNFDLVIDTTHMKPLAVLHAVRKYLKERGIVVPRDTD